MNAILIECLLMFLLATMVGLNDSVSYSQALGVCFAMAAISDKDGDNDTQARAFVRDYETAVRPLEIEVNRCWWAANISGKDEDFRLKEAAETKLNVQLSDPRKFAELKTIHQGRINDPILRRQIQALYLEYLPKQVDPGLLKQILALENSLQKKFNIYRPEVNGRKLTNNEVREILHTSKDSAERRAVWESSKSVGKQIEGDLKKLVKLRNDAAHKLGFKDFFVMQLELNEQIPEQVEKLFDELDALTREPFHAAKAEIDAALARQCGIETGQLRPWHYHDPFFQESPAIFNKGGEKVYKALDAVKLCREFYDGIGLPVDDILASSDLYEKSGKSPHAFCQDIDREGDVRVLANVVPGEEWLSTMLHELGHAVYSKNIPRTLPFALRDASHPLTTEGIAMMFERFPGNARWLATLGAVVPDPAAFSAAAAKSRRCRLLIFSRWCQVIFHFEKQLYSNPDQDLNRLWWELVEKYQEVKRPEGRNEPDYASKIHIVTVPAYYHNYLLGQLFAAQVHRTIARDVLKGADPETAIYVGDKSVGEYLREKIFAPGRKMTWNELARYATGEELNPKAFAAEIGIK
jgi:peptidyl-dipeptidase A